MVFSPCPNDRYFAFLLKLVYDEEREKGTVVPDFDTETLQAIEAVEDPVKVILSPGYYEFIIAFLGAMYKELGSSGADTVPIENFFRSLDQWMFGEGWHTEGYTLH